MPPSASSITAKRRGLFADIQRLYADDLPVLPMFFRVDPFVIPKRSRAWCRPAISTARPVDRAVALGGMAIR